MRPALLFVFLLLGCESASSSSELRFQMIRADGQNAARGLSGHLVVEVEQGGVPLSCPDGPCATPILGGDFSLTLPIRSLTDDTRVNAWLCDGTESPAECTLDRADRVGALPRFAVFGEQLETGELPVRLVMEPHDGCAVLEAPAVSTMGEDVILSVARRDAAAVVRRNAAVVVGGVAGSGRSGAVDFYDQIVAELRPPLASVAALGRARGAALSDDLSLVVGQEGGLLLARNPAPGPPVAAAVALHEGAGAASAVVDRPGGAAVVGGAGGTTASWVDVEGAVTASDLGTARVEPAAAALASGVLVVGGGEGAEVARPTGSSDLDVPPELVPADARGGFVAVSPNGDAALYFGFETADGVSADSVLFTGCSECAAAPGPAWVDARQGASLARTAAGTTWIVGGDGSRQVDRIVWEGAQPRFVTQPEMLAHARAGAAVVEQASGVVVVLGGEGPEGLRGDVELCFPTRLDAL